MVPEAGLEPAQDIIPRDFKSNALPFVINNLYSINICLWFVVNC